MPVGEFKQTVLKALELQYAKKCFFYGYFFYHLISERFYDD